MAATERRLGVSRRGMTVLGKVPVAPKPINLPSQRSTFCWGNAGRFPSGKMESTLLDPESSSEKLQSKLVAPTSTKNLGDGVDLQEDSKLHSATARANSFPSGAAVTTNMASNNVAKMEEPRKFSSYPCNSVESWKKELADSPHPKSEDGCSRGASAVPPGFSHNGAHGNTSSSGMSSTDSQCIGGGNRNQSDMPQNNGSHGIPGMPCRSGTKDREIIVIHMVGGPGFYGNYPPQLGFPESYNRNGGLFGSSPLQFGNFEPIFGLPGHGRLDGGALFSAAPGSEVSDEHEDFICYEKECYKGACHDVRRHRNSWVHGSFSGDTFFGRAEGDVYDPLISGATPTIRSRSLSQRHLSKNAGKSRSFYRNGRVVPISTEELVAKPASEKRITLLTKVPRHDMLARNTFKGVVGSCKDAQNFPVSLAYLNEEFDEDEGKPPLEISEPKKVTEDIQVETRRPVGVSISSEMIEKATSPKETKVESKGIPLSKTTCNDKCLHCRNNAAIGGSATLVCQACEKTTVCESNFSPSQRDMESAEEVPVAPVGKDSCSDGCKAEVKHVILDADNYSRNTLKSEAVSKEQQIAAGHKSPLILSHSRNAEVSKDTSLSVAVSLKKSAVRQQNLVFKKKLQSKAMTKAGIRVSKAHVMARKPGSKGASVTSLTSCSDLKGILEVAKVHQEDAVQESSPPATSQSNHSRVSGSSTTPAPPMKNAARQQKVFYRKKSTEQADMGLQSSRKCSNISHSVESSSVLPQAALGIEQEKDTANLASSASTSKYHIIRRRVYHVVEGSERDYYVPTVPLSCNDKSDELSTQQLKISKEEAVPISAASSHLSGWESLLLQEAKSERISHTCCTDDTFSAVVSLQPPRSSQLSSMRDDNATKKYEKSGRQTAWKPKVTHETAGSGKAWKGQEQQGGFLASTTVNEASEGKTDSSHSGPVGILSSQNSENTDEKHFLETRKELSSESARSSSGPSKCEQDNQVLICEKHAEELVISMVAVGEPGQVKSGPIEKNAEEMPASGSSAQEAYRNAEASAPEQDTQTCSQENTAGTCKPFVKKKAMSYEKADRYHQIMFKRYKETGQWKPKAEVHKKLPKSKAKVCSS